MWNSVIRRVVEPPVPQSANNKKSIPERISHAWEPLKSSFSVQLFSAATVVEVLGFVFGWHKHLEHMGLWPSWAPAVNISIYAVFTILCARAIFLLAEKNGELRDQVTVCAGQSESNTRVVAALHDIIHETRDSLLADNAFLSFLPASEEDGVKRRPDVSAEQCDDADFITRLENYSHEVQGIVNKSPAQERPEIYKRVATPEVQHAGV